jgi:hypothetical protein
MSAVIRPGELEQHIALLEEARGLHALITATRNSPTVGASFFVSVENDGRDAERYEITNEELVSVLEARLTNVETKLTNRNVTLKRPDFPKGPMFPDIPSYTQKEPEQSEGETQ